jgi:hypothetical protein
MARTVSQIQSQIIAAIASNTNLNYVDDNGITRNITYNTSNRAIWRNITFIVSAAIAVFEQLQDLFLAAVEAQVAQSAAASTLWVQAKMFAFQYSVSNPQVVQLVNTIPQFPVVDPTLQIITACSVTPGLDYTVNVKVATTSGNQLAPLNLQQVAAAQAYITTIGDARTTYNVSSQYPDRIYVVPMIYYSGQYSPVIQTNVTNAVNSYLQQLSQINFNGSIKMSDLENILRNLTGVQDVVLNTVAARPYNATPPPTPVFTSTMIQNSTVMQRLFQPTAGYMIFEDTPGYTLTDVLIPGTLSASGAITPGNATLIAI